MSRPLSEAELEQRRAAARKRWAQAGLAVAGAGAAGYSIPQAFMSPRAPTRDEVGAEFRRQGKIAMGALRRAGADTATRSRIWAGDRRTTLAEIEGGLRPIGNRKVQAASAVALALIAAGVAMPSVIRSQELVAARESRTAERAQRAIQWGGGVLGAMGALRAAMPAVRRVPRSAIAAGGALAATAAASRS